MFLAIQTILVYFFIFLLHGEETQQIINRGWFVCSYMWEFDDDLFNSDGQFLLFRYCLVDVGNNTFKNGFN